MRKVWVAQIEKEIAQERAHVIPESRNIDMTDDERLANRRRRLYRLRPC